jgi:hypothetical protein
MAGGWFSCKSYTSSYLLSRCRKEITSCLSASRSVTSCLHRGQWLATWHLAGMFQVVQLSSDHGNSWLMRAMYTLITVSLDMPRCHQGSQECLGLDDQLWKPGLVQPVLICLV